VKQSDSLASLIPADFATDVKTRLGGEAWLSLLPGLIGDLFNKWELHLDGPGTEARSQ
jgi:hypothetical protein